MPCTKCRVANEIPHPLSPERVKLQRVTPSGLLFNFIEFAPGYTGGYELLRSFGSKTIYD